MNAHTTRERAAALVAPPTATDWFRIEDVVQNEAGGTSADVYVYGVIGGGFWSDGVSAKDFVKTLAEVDADTINLYVNSPGGSVYDGIAMKAAIERHSANVIAHVDSLAASAASFLIMGANEVVMGADADLMIHDALMITWGNAADHRDGADELDRVSDKISAMYARKASGDAADWRALMVAETWYSADEAVEAGLADRVASEAATEDAKNLRNTFDLSIFDHAGRGDAAAPVPVERVAELRSTYDSPAAFYDRLRAVRDERRTQPPAEPGTPRNTDKEGADTMPALNKEIATRLGLTVAEDALTDEVVLNALDEALAERAETTTAATENTVTVDRAVWEETQAQATQGATAFANLEASRREGIVDKALREGKITAASRQDWLDSLVKNEAGTVKILDSLAGGAVLNTEERGTTGTTEDTADGDQLYNTFYGTNDSKED